MDAVPGIFSRSSVLTSCASLKRTVSGSRDIRVEAADELTTGFTVSNATWSTLAAHYDTPALVEILFVAGQYTMLSMVANAAGVGLPEGLAPVPPGR